MTVVAFVVFALALVAMVAAHVHFVKQALSHVRAQVEAEEKRQLALYQQHKGNQQEMARMQRVIDALAERAHATIEDARLVHARVDQHFAHPVVKRFLDEGAPGNGG